MRRINQSAEDITLALTPDEVATLCNALNEALEQIEEWAFETRMGASQDEVRRLLDDLGKDK